MKIRNIGAPNSIARYVANTTWGENRWAVMEYTPQGPVCRAASAKKEVAERYMAQGRYLIDLSTYFPVNQ